MKDQWDELAEYLGKAIAKRWFAISSSKNRQAKQNGKANGLVNSDVGNPMGAEFESAPLTSQPTLAPIQPKDAERLHD